MRTDHPLLSRAALAVGTLMMSVVAFADDVPELESPNQREVSMTIGFSYFFFRERRAEARDLRQMGEGIQQSIRERFDRLEEILRRDSAPQTDVAPVNSLRSVRPNQPPFYQ